MTHVHIVHSCILNVPQGVKDGDKPIQDPQLLWREDFAGDGSLSGLDEASWSCHIGNGSEYGIPGK